MKCVVVDMRNRLFGDAISGSLQHFDAGFRVYQTEGTAAEDLCVDTHAHDNTTYTGMKLVNTAEDGKTKTKTETKTKASRKETRKNSL